MVPAWWVSHLELDWADAAFRGSGSRLGEGYTLVRYDRLGVGMSDREVLDDELHGDRVRGSLPRACGSSAALWRVRRWVIDHRSGGPGVGRFHRPFALGDLGRLLADIFLGESDSAERERLARYQRVAASPETAAALLGLTYRNDVRAELPHVHAPTVVVHRRGDRAIPYHLGRELAATIPAATLIRHTHSSLLASDEQRSSPVGNGRST